MLQRELRINFKSFCIWNIVLMALFLVIFLVYPSIINSDNLVYLNQMMEIFPEELLKAFNMDISSIDSAYGWLKTEGFIFILLITGVYSGILGSNILLKEENDKTIEYLHSLPITRLQIVTSKILCGLFYVIVMVLVIGIFNYIGLKLSGPFDEKAYLLLSVTPIFANIVIFAITIFLSTFTHKSKKMTAISFSIVFISYFLKAISELSSQVEFLQYASVFTLADIRHVILNQTINPMMPLIALVITAVFLWLTINHYQRKELV